MLGEKQKAVNKEILSLEIDDLLGSFRYAHISRSSGYKMVKTIFQTIKDALLRGEDVTIAKFGKFYVHTRPQSRVQVNYMYGGKRGPDQLITLPVKRYVKFQPFDALLEMVNDAD